MGSRKEAVKQPDYGPDYGWVIEVDGVPIGELTDPRWEDMFWVSYAIRIREGVDKRWEALKTNDFWRDDKWTQLSYRHKVTGEFIERALPVSRLTEDGRINMRGLCSRDEINREKPSWWERFSNWWFGR